MEQKNIETKYNKLIIALSVIIPLAVAGLFGVNLRKLGYDVEPLSFLPPIYATINGFTAVLLIAAVVAIKNKKRTLHVLFIINKGHFIEIIVIQLIKKLLKKVKEIFFIISPYCHSVNINCLLAENRYLL